MKRHSNIKGTSVPFMLLWRFNNLLSIFIHSYLRAVIYILLIIDQALTFFTHIFPDFFRYFVPIIKEDGGAGFLERKGEGNKAD